MPFDATADVSVEAVPDTETTGEDDATDGNNAGAAGETIGADVAVGVPAGAEYVAAGTAAVVVAAAVPAAVAGAAVAAGIGTGVLPMGMVRIVETPMSPHMLHSTYVVV